MALWRRAARGHGEDAPARALAGVASVVYAVAAAAVLLWISLQRRAADRRERAES